MLGVDVSWGTIDAIDVGYPTLEKFQKWYNEYSFHDNYHYFITGAFIEQRLTWDMDILLFGPRDNDIIADILYSAHSSAMREFKFCIDMQYYGISFSEFLQRRKTLSNTIISKLKITDFVRANGIDFNIPNGIKLQENLFEFKGDLFNSNFLKKQQARKYKTNPICIYPDKNGLEKLKEVVLHEEI